MRFSDSTNLSLVKPSTGRPYLKTCRLLAWCLGVLGLTMFTLSPAWSEDGALDPSFNPGVGATSVPMLWWHTNYTDGSGKMMIIGAFREMGGASRTCIARVFGDGTLDPSFNAPLDTSSSAVNGCILLNPNDPNTQMLICGDFSIPSASGTYYGVARLNADGSVDSTFAHAFSAGDGVQAFGRQSSGKIVVGGYALQVNGYAGSAYYLLRLNADGSVDTTYPMRSAPGGAVHSMQVYPASDPNFPNQVRVFGDIPRISDPTHWDYIVRFSSDGNSVLWSLGDERVNGTIIGLISQGSNLIIYGAFTQVDGVSRNGIARFLPDWTLDPSFNIGTGANGHVKRVTVSGTKLVLNGYFNSFNGTACGYLVRLNTDGSVDNTFNVGAGADDRIWGVILQGDGTWVLLGAFQSFNGSPRQCLAALDNAGNLSSRFASFTVGYATSQAKVYDVKYYWWNTEGGPKIIVGGSFSGYGGKLHQRAARVNGNGTPVSSFRAGAGPAPVYGLGYQVSDGKMLIAGKFGTATGYVGRTGLARLNNDGTVDLTFNPVLAKADGTLPDLYHVQAWNPNGRILVGGDFASVNGVARSGIAALNANGTLDATFNFNPASMPGLTNIIIQGAADDDGGAFAIVGKATYSGQTCGFLARLNADGSLDTTFANDPSPVPHVVIFDGEVRAMTGEEGGRLYVGGDFTHIIGGNNPTRNYLARFSQNGILDNTFAPTGPNGPVYALRNQWNDNKVLVGGAFTTYNGVARNNIARFKPEGGALDTSFNPGSGANGPVYAIDWDGSRKAVIGGEFTTYNGVSRPRIAQILAGRRPGNPALPLLLMDTVPEQ
ncbi:MAG: delta-60 repeat domain-containing protein [Thermodesulfobacteriota bacterium]